MASKLVSGKWRVQLPINGHSLGASVSLCKDANMGARRMERKTGLGQDLLPNTGWNWTCPDLVDLHIADLTEVGKEIGRSKRLDLDFRLKNPWKLTGPISIASEPSKLAKE